MASETFVQLAIPRFDGHYDHWSTLMENFLRSKEYWHIVEAGVAKPVVGTDRINVDRQYIKHCPGLIYLFACNV